MSDTSWAHDVIDAALEQRVDELAELVRALPPEAIEALNVAALGVAFTCHEATKGPGANG